MRITAIKIILPLFLLLLAQSGGVEAAPSRFDCLVKLGNNASKEDIDSCMKGANPSISTSPSQVGSIDTGSE